MGQDANLEWESIVEKVQVLLILYIVDKVSYVDAPKTIMPSMARAMVAPFNFAKDRQVVWAMNGDVNVVTNPREYMGISQGTW